MTLLKDYLHKITFKVLDKKFSCQYGDKDFDDSNIMIHVKDDTLFPTLDKNKLTMVTVFNILSYNELLMF